MSHRVRSTAQIGIILLLLVVLFSPSLRAQFSNGGGVGVSQSYVDGAVTSMQSTIMAAMPQPATSAPATDATAGVIGTQTMRYMLEDSVRPARYRSGSCTLSGGVGTCSLTWSTPFSVTPNPIGDPAVVNTGTATAMIQCNWTAVSTTGASFKCVQPSITLTISLGALTILPNATNGLVVSGTAVQPL